MRKYDYAKAHIMIFDNRPFEDDSNGFRAEAIPEHELIPYQAVREVARGKALVLAPHPDDEALGCGGAILRHVKLGDPVEVIILTDGTALADEVERDEYARRRQQECIEAAGFLGYGNPSFWGRPDRGLRYGEQFIQELMEAFRTAEPAVVYAPSPSELHPDHRVVALAAAEALRRLSRDIKLAYYEVSAPLVPNLLLDISDLYLRKAEAIACFQSQLTTQAYDKQIASLNYYRTYTLGRNVEAAEAYRILDARTLEHSSRMHRFIEPQDLPSEDPSAWPLVSIIVRSIGRIELYEALDSIAAQTYPNIEVIVVNALGAGHPKLRKECGRFPIRLVAEERQLPRSAAANRGLSVAQGRYIGFLDDDDWLMPDHVATLVTTLRQQRLSRAAYAGVRCVRREGGKWHQVHQYNEPFDKTRLLCQNFLPIHSVLFDRSLIEEDCAFDEGFDIYEDWDFWVQLAQKTSFIHIDRITASYRISLQGGFGVIGDQATVEASLTHFLQKWRTLWSPQELRAIIEYAKNAVKAPFLEAQVEIQEKQLQSKEQQLADQRAVLGSHHAALEQIAAQREILIRELREEVHRLMGLKASLEDELAEAINRAQTLGDELDALYHSTSWRITYPLRAFKKKGSSLGRALRSITGTVLRELFRALPLSQRNKQCLKSALFRRLRFLIEDTVAYRSWTAQQGMESALARNEESDNISLSALQPPKIVKLRDGELLQKANELAFNEQLEPEVSIIIPVYNNIRYTLECLISIREHSPRRAYEVIVVDDASDDTTHKLLSRIKGLKIIANRENLGFLRSCNRGAEHALGKYLLILNNDTQVLPDWLDALADTFRDLPNIGLVGSKLIYPSGHLQEAGAIMHANGEAALVGLNNHPAKPVFNRLREVDYCSCACAMIETTLFRKLGGFDETFAPAYYEDADLALRVRQAGLRVMYQPASQVVHHLSVSTNDADLGKMHRIEINRDKFLDKWSTELQVLDTVRLIAFYLPQFHPIPENDRWWGQGFTEWTNVTKGRPNFESHYQPHQPAELGFYDLRVPEVRVAQAELAKEHGIHGFCYYYYWFNGTRLLHRPLNEVLGSGKPDFPFCVCWANENWTRRWDGLDSEILIAQRYSPEDDLAFIDSLIPALRDERYIRIAGKPLLLIYRTELLPNPKATSERWREHCIAQGVGDIYLACVQSFGKAAHHMTPDEYGFDAAVEFPPHGLSALTEPPAELTNRDFSGLFFDYIGTADNFIHRKPPEHKLFRTVIPSWDNTARRQNDGHIFLNSSPGAYERWLREMVDYTRKFHFGDERIVFINAWNEWAEGNHLEPDKKYDRLYLQATQRALESVCAGRNRDVPRFKQAG